MAFWDWLTGGGSASIPATTGSDGTTSVGGWTFAPGMQEAGYGLPTSGPTPSQPSSGTDWNAVAKGLATLTDSNKASTGAGTSSDSGNASSVRNVQSAGVGGGRSSISLNNLVQLLAERQQKLLDAATAGPGGAGYGQPVKQTASTGGLLGY